MPKPKYVIHVDGKDHQVSLENIEKYGIENYAKSYPGATVRMRDSEDEDYDIPISDFQRAHETGLRPFTVMTYGADEPQPESWESAGKGKINIRMPVNKESGQQLAPDYHPLQREQEKKQQLQIEPSVQQKNQDSVLQLGDVSRRSVLKMGLPDAEVKQAIESSEQSAPSSEISSVEPNPIDSIWNNELKGVVDGLIEQTREQGRKELAEYNKQVYADKPWWGFSGAAGQARSQDNIYAKAVDAQNVITGVSRYLDSRHQNSGLENVQGELSEKDGNDMRTALMQKVYDYLVQKNIPKSTTEYILRSAFEGSTLGNLMGLANEKSTVQRQIEQQGTQHYDADGIEQFAGTAAGIAMDLPVMYVTGGFGSSAAKAVAQPIINNIAKRYLVAGISESAARGIASRVVQQSGIRWGVRTAAESANFAALEGVGSTVSQLYSTGEVDLGKVAESAGKGAATGAAMGVFGMIPERISSLGKQGFGKAVGKSAGYAASLGGRTVILTGSSVMGQYMNNPDFNIQDVNWTDELVHAGLINIGFDVLGVVKKYSPKDGIQNVNLNDIHLSKDNIRQLNEAGVKGRDAKEIVESILQIREANELSRSPEGAEGLAGKEWADVSQKMGFSKEQSVIGQLLINPNIDLSTKAKVGYLITGNYFKLSPSTNIGEVEEAADGTFKVDMFNSTGQVNETMNFKSREEADNYRHVSMNQVKPNQVSALEEMMQTAGKMSSATRLFDMFSQQFGMSREQVGEVYTRGQNGEKLEGQEKKMFEMLDSTIKNVTSTEDYHYSLSSLKNRMDEGYGKESGWMDKVLKKKYNSLTEEESRAYNEYIQNMQNVLQGEKTARHIESMEMKETVPNEEVQGPEGQHLSPGENMEGTQHLQEQAPLQEQVKTVGHSRGAFIYRNHNPKEMRGTVVRERVSKDRLIRSGFDESSIQSLVDASEDQRRQILSSLDDNTRRLADDYLEQRDALEGLNDALDEAHIPEVQAANQKIQVMSPTGRVIVVDLGKYGDREHEVGVVVNGMDTEGSFTSSERQLIVVPLRTVNGKADFNSFDEGKAISIVSSGGNLPSFLDQGTVLNEMLTDYQADADILDTPSIMPGQSYTLATAEGETFNVSVLGKHPGGQWTVQEEGQAKPELISDEDLSAMIGNAETLPYIQEYADADARFAAEQKKVAKEQERVAARQAEEVEKARVAEEMKKPVNRLAKYPEGHKNAGKPDYENSKPDDVRAYLVESLGVEGAVKSIRNQISSLQQQEKEQDEKLQKDRTEVANSELGPEETISAHEFLDGEIKTLASTRERLSFWNNILEITGGKSSGQMQAAANKAEAARKAQRTKQTVYKPGKEYDEVKKRVLDSPEASDILSDLLPHTPEELAATVLAGGSIRITPESIKEESGYKNKDISGFVGLVAEHGKGGISIRDAGDRLMQIDREEGMNILDQYDPNAGVDAILSALSGVRTIGDLNRMVERNRIAQAEQLYQQETDAIMEEMERASWKEYGMSYADLKTLQDAIASSVMERATYFVEDFEKSDEYIDFITNFVETKESNNDGQEKTDGGRSHGNSEHENAENEPQGAVGTVAGSQEGNDRIGEEVSETKAGGRGGRSERIAEGDTHLPDEAGKASDGSGTEGINPVGKAKEVYEKKEKPVSASSSDIETEPEEKKNDTEQNTVLNHIEEAREMVDPSPSEAQKEAGNYKKGHVRIDGYDVTIENPKGSVRSGKDAGGQEWSITMNNDYGYIRGTKAVDGDHIDIFLSDNPIDGNVYVVDQLDNKGEYDKPKVMYGFNSMEEARSAYLSNYSDGWESRIGTITGVTKDEFKKWIDSSVRKTKPFSEYKRVKPVTGEQSEEDRIIEKAKADGTYMKAPNGKLTNLNEKQWVQVRTEAFKNWFGDWEKVARIEKLRVSRPVEITGEEYKGNYELNRDSAQKYILNNLRGEYTIGDTGEKVKIAKKGAKKVTSHSQGNEAHIKSIAVIPSLIENSIFIEERPAYKDNAQYDSYRYYATGLKIGGEDYIVRVTIGVKDGEFYYDHYLTEIEKGNLIKAAQSFKPTEDAPIPSYAGNKDRVLPSILQTNASKVVDDNGEPLVMFHGTSTGGFNIFNTYGSNFGLFGQGAYFTNNPNVGESYTQKGKGDRKQVYSVFLNIRHPLDMDSRDVEQGWKDVLPEDIEVEINENSTNESVYKGILESFEYNEYPQSEAQEILYGLPEALGHDGVTHIGGGRYGRKDGVRHKVWIALNPNQIKSATDNTGEFSSSNDDVRFREVGNEEISSFANKYNLDETDVKKYAQSMKMKNLGGASYAFKSISRNVLLQNTDLSLGQFVKVFSPIKKELYEKFGDVDSLREEHVRQEMEARNVEKRMNMTPEERRKSLASETEDVTREDQIFINDALVNASISSTTTNNEEVNTIFNEELSTLTEENSDKVTFNLGTPSEVLLSAGIANKPMKLYGNKVIKKMKKHGFNLSELENLPEAVANPIAVFDNSGREGNRSILTELKTDNGNFLVTIDLGGSKDIDFNIVSSVFGKTDNKVVNWINKGYATYINKEKALGYLYYPAPIAETPKSQELSDITKIIGNFENPTLEQGKINAAVDEISESLHTPIEKITSSEQLPQGEARKRIEEGENVKGWYSPKENKVYLYMPNAVSAEDAQATIFHEVVAHKGLRELFGNDFGTMLENVYANASSSIRKSIEQMASDGEIPISVATEEYMAGLAERGPATEEEISLWGKIKKFLLDLLRKVGIRLGFKLKDSDLRYILWESLSRLRSSGDPVNVAKEAVMRSKFGIGEFAENLRFSLRGKPRRKEGESMISYNRRLKEWESEKAEAERTRSIEEGGEKGHSINEELDSLTMEMMMHPHPQRKLDSKGAPIETDEDFNARTQDWESWYKSRGQEIRNRMIELHEQAESGKAKARSEEMKTLEEHLREGTSPDNKVPEGFSPDAPDNVNNLTKEEMRDIRKSFQERMDDMKISLSRSQAKKEIRQEIIERRRYIETSNLEDTFFIDEIKKTAGNNKDILKVIPAYIEGTYTGEVTPELVKTAKMVSDWFEEVYNLMAEEGILYDAPQIQNYVTHIWDWKRSPKEAQDKYTDFINTMRMRSPFTRHRVIPSYAEGIEMGMKPKYDDITGIIMEYGHYATESIANHRIVEFLKNFQIGIPGGKDNLPMNMDIIVRESVKDPAYSRMNHTAMEGYKILNVVKPFIAPVFGDQRIIDPSHLNALTNKLIDGVWATSGLMKKVALSFSFFHHGALTETAVAMLKPWGAGKVIAKNIIWDVITKGGIPAVNDKESARDAVKHLVSLGASNDYAVADVSNLTTKLYQFTKDKNIPVAQQAARLLDFLNKGSDKILWDIIHDGYKIASYSKMSKEVRDKAKAKGWTQEQTESALDECGHLVNDTFGGLHFDILGYSPKSVRIMRALLLSPDWTLATIRQALSPLGFGRLYGDDGFWEGLTSKEPASVTRRKYGREFWITAGLFFYGLMNGLNAYFRIQDEEEHLKKAEEMRKIDPDYKSPYELAYPDGLKWYDYTMPGNAIGQQTHLFTGRYSDGTESYARWGKQFRELPELFFGRDGLSFPGPMIDKLSGKANPLMASVFEFVSGHSLSGWENQDMKDKKGWERDVARLYLLAKKFLPYSVPTQEDKDFMLLDLVMPSSKGFTPGKAINYFEKGIKGGDFNYVAAVYNACVMNGLHPEKYFNVAKAKIEAEAKANTLIGIETLQDASKAFDGTDDLKERKRLLRYMEQQFGAQDYHAVSQEEIVRQAMDIVNGELPDITSNDNYLKNATSQDIADDYRIKKNAAGLKPYYQDYTELAGSNPDAAKRMLKEKVRYIQGYQIATTARSKINKLKKMFGKGDDDKVMGEIRKMRKLYFDEMDKLE